LAFLIFSATMRSEKRNYAVAERVSAYRGREYFEIPTRMVNYPRALRFPLTWEQRLDMFRESAAWLAKHNQ
jgi:hypothetical protein